MAAFPDKLRLRLTLATVLVGTLMLHGAFLALPERGLPTYARRIASSAHVEFFIRAALNPGLGKTLVGYEAQLNDGLPATFSRMKGPANLGFHVALHRLAQLPVVADALDLAITQEPGLVAEVRDLLGERPTQFPELSPHLLHEILRTMLLMPFASWLIASVLPVPAFLLGFALFHARSQAVLVAVFSAVVPAIVVENVQLDGNVFPLLFLTSLALFVYAWESRRQGLLLVAGWGGLGFSGHWTGRS